ncbi:MAG: S-adenosylmethionine:tRNA ribosyltransferase-isomerase [Myxococcota bacterium]
MIPATHPRPRDGSRLLVIGDGLADHRVADLPALLSPGDLLVVNDAFTLPASIRGVHAGTVVELRLAQAPDEREEAPAVVFGPGSWRDRTEDREDPPPLAPGDVIETDAGPIGVVGQDADHPRLLRVHVPEAVLWDEGRPVQYSYLDRPLRLAEVQTAYATRPWAVEMPSAGRPLGLALQQRLRANRIGVVALTHAAGLSSTGDAALDAALPLPERYAVPPATWEAVGEARRVVAVGTSVVRALESAVDGALSGTTTLRVGPATSLRVVDALMSGMHEPGESHFAMMEAFRPRHELMRAHAHATHQGYRNHEFGDSTLLFRHRAR